MKHRLRGYKKVVAGNGALIVLLTVLFYAQAGCGGPSLQSALKRNSSLYVMTERREMTLFLADIAGGEVIGSGVLPAAFGEIEETAAGVLRRKTAGKVLSSAEYTPPSDGSGPDFSKADIGFVASLDISLVYEALPSSDGVPPYSYRLKGRVIMVIGEKGSEGRIVPISKEPLLLASAERTLPIKTGEIRGLDALKALLPPEGMLGELKEKTKRNLDAYLAKEGIKG